MSLPSPTLDRSRLLAMGWAAFVAMSWTWCIGMYLPVLMVRDFGTPGWFAFAVPNVLGAAAMGWVLHRPGAAADLARQHWPAAAGFSIITVLFHAFFAGWVIRALVGDAALVVIPAAAVGFYYLGQRGRGDLLTAGALLVVSLVAIGIAISLPPSQPRVFIAMHRPGLEWLAPVCIFGFFLCPYLDLTFLRARASTAANPGIAAFAIGFGLLFPVMIGFTYWYAPLLQPQNLNSVSSPLKWIIGGYMILQSAFTVTVHTRAIGNGLRAKTPSLAASFFLGLIIVYFLGAWSDRFVPRALLPAYMGSGEFVYRVFMSFYALIFPAYVWICILPPGAGRSISRRRKLTVFAAAVIIAAPMFALALLDDPLIWLMGPGLLVVVASRLAFLSRSRKPSAALK